MEYEALVAFSLLPIIFWFFTKFWQKIFVQKNKISNKFLHYLKFSAFRMLQSDAYHLNWRTDWALCTAVSFDATVDCERNSLTDFFCLKLTKNRFPWTLSTLQKKFYPVARTIKLNCASWRPLDYWIAWRGSREHFRVRSFVDRWSGQGIL